MHINVVPQIRLHLNAIGFSARLPWMKYDVLFTASNDLTYGLQEEVVNLNEQFSHLKSLVSILCLGLCSSLSFLVGRQSLYFHSFIWDVVALLMP